MSRVHPTAWLAAVTVSAAWGCEGKEMETAVSSVVLDDFHGLWKDEDWTFRDDGGTIDDDIFEDELLRVRHVGDGVMEFRRGARWPDATYEGELVWDTSDGLELVAWDLGDAQGDGRIRLTDAQPAEGDRHAIGSWVCTTDTQAEVTTYYAVFDQALVVECTSDGGAGLAGEWSFAEGIGLVRVAGLGLDLVAPW